MDPLLPLLEVPVLNTNMPLTPATPALADLNIKLPLLVAELYPVVTRIRPPLPTTALVVPADRIKGPPLPLLPLPTAI